MSLNSSFIYGLLEGLRCKSQHKLNIVQIGANDGIANDPLINWVKNNLETHTIALVEPQSDIYEKLKNNYAFHSSATFFNNAVGPKGYLNLYRINSEYEHLYRGIIASGITSYNREYVLRKIKKNLDIPNNSDPEDYLEEFQVETLPLINLLKTNNHTHPSVDFLQIDTEGFDDQVIYHAGLEQIKPAAINFEFIHLSKEKLQKLYQYLSALDYRIIQWSSEDACAIASSQLISEKGK